MYFRINLHLHFIEHRLLMPFMRCVQLFDSPAVGSAPAVCFGKHSQFQVPTGFSSFHPSFLLVHERWRLGVRGCMSDGSGDELEVTGADWSGAANEDAFELDDDAAFDVASDADLAGHDDDDFFDVDEATDLAGSSIALATFGLMRTSLTRGRR